MKSFLSSCAAIAIALVISTVVASAVAGGVYKVVDDQGNITYTDTPPAEITADEMVLPVINPISSPTLTPSPAAERSPISTDIETVMAFTGYSSVVMVAPLDGSLVRFDQPKLMAQLALTPALQADHLVQFYIDGSAYGRAIPAISLAIGGLERGSHRISARVLSSQGAVLAITEPVTVHVQRHFKRK